MFDRCRAWRSLLTRRAEGVLSPSERAVLNNHISNCESCRRMQAADEALQDLCFTLDSGADRTPARNFDDRVISELRSLPLENAAPTKWRDRVRAYSSGISFEFCVQLAGGGLAAASITAFLLVSALNPTPASKSLSAYEIQSASPAERNEPPVPLESLFQSPTPRAAMLWAAPGRPPFRPNGVDTSPASRRQDKPDRRATHKRGARASNRTVLS